MALWRRTVTAATLLCMLAMLLTGLAPGGTAMAADASNILLADDFESGTISSEWKIEDGTYAVQNGILMATHVNAGVSAGDASWTDYSIESKVRLNNDGAYGGIMFRYQNLQNNYWLRLYKPASGAARAELIRRVNNAATVVTTYNYAFARNVWYNLKVVVRGSQIRVYLDDNKIIETTDTTYASGKIGLRNLTQTMSADDVVVRALGETATPAPSGLAAGTPGATVVPLAWNSIGEWAYDVQYYLYRATSETGEYTRIYAGSDRSYNDTGLQPGATYYYKVRSTDGTDVSDFSAPVSATTSVVQVSAPTGLNATNIAHTSMTLTWDAVPGATAYTLQRSISLAGTYTAVYTGAANEYRDEGLASGLTYYYKVSVSVANDASPASAPVHAATTFEPIEPTNTVTVGAVKQDTRGQVIEAHGGGFLQMEDEQGPIYYWVGEDKSHNSSSFNGVNLYSSRDLLNWTFENMILKPDPGNPGLVNNKVERPKLVYNEKTGKYVLWGHWETADSYSTSQIAVAVSDTVNGDYEFLGHWRPGGQTKNWRVVNSQYVDDVTGAQVTIDGYSSRDFTVYVEPETKKAYLISAENHETMRIYELNDDYTDVVAEGSHQIFVGNHREAPAIVKEGDYYFMITSSQSGWYPNQTLYAYTTDIMGGADSWSELMPLGNNSTYYSQPTNIMTVTGEAGNSYIYMGDRWNGSALSTSTYVWLPLSIAGNQMSLQYVPAWSFENGAIVLPESAPLISRGKPTTTNVNYDSAYSLEKANDGYYFNTKTTGSNSDYFRPSAVPFQWVVDLEDKYDLERIDISFNSWNGSESYHQYTVEGSNDLTSWTVVADASSNTTVAYKSHALSGEYRYVRLNVSKVVNVHNGNSASFAAGLVEVEVYGSELQPETNKTALQELYDAHKEQINDNYTAASWSSFVNALTEARVALDNGAATQQQIDDAWQSLSAAIDGLEQNPAGPAPVSLTGPVSVVSNQLFEVTLGLNTVAGSVYAHDFTFNYDPAQVEYVAAEPIKSGFSLLDQTAEPGHIRFIANDLQPGEAGGSPAALMKVQFRAKALAADAIGNIYLSDVVLADAAGTETEMTESVSYSFGIAAVSKAALDAAIADALTLHGAAVEGNLAGQYPAGSKAALWLAIQAAVAVQENDAVIQSQVDQALQAITAAVQTFEALALTHASGDLNGDSRLGVGDLALMSSVYYGKNQDDANWNMYKKADLTADGRVDIEDLRKLAQMILGKI
jgi:hypothetical protein